MKAPEWFWHWPIAVVLVIMAPLIVVFCGHDGVSTIGDDSVSYLTLARYLAGSAPPWIAQWVPAQRHFPPLFPLALAAAGGASDLLRAHLVVGAFAILALVAIYAYGLRLSQNRWAAILLVAAFVLTPTAWISVNGILSESMYLFLSLAALVYFMARLEGRDASWVEWAIFGLLLAGSLLARAAGIALVAAYIAYLGVRIARGSREIVRMTLPLAIVVAFLGGWLLVRPSAGGDHYLQTTSTLLGSWLSEPWLMLSLGARFLAEGWLNSLAAEGDMSVVSQVVFAVAALAAIAGAMLRAARNGPDGWYVLATLAMLLGWVFDNENMRRLLYPILPLMFGHAALAVVALADRIGLAPRQQHIAVLASAAIVASLCFPATLLIAQKSLDRAPFLAGGHLSAADITDYYRIVNLQRSRAMAAKQAAVITGLELLRRATPPGARVMWMSPEYVALLGDRPGVPYEYGWDDRALAEAIRKGNVDFVIASAIYKTDVRLKHGDGLAVGTRVPAYATAVLTVPNAVVGGDEFVLFRIDRVRLDSFLSR